MLGDHPLEYRALLIFARFKPLAAWSLSAGALGTSLAIYQSNGLPLETIPMIVAILCVVLMQYVAHPINDLMDLELDRQAPISSTGRYKPIVDGMISTGETRMLSLSIVVMILVLLAYLILLHPILLLPAAYGLVALVGYNHHSTRWAYGPFTELYLSMPINAISVAVIAFIGSGLLTPLTIMVSAVFGFVSSTFFVTMMSMDYKVDRLNGKMTTIASYPAVRWCTIYPLLGIGPILLCLPFVAASIGAGPAILIALLSALILIILSLIGSEADKERLLSLSIGAKDIASSTGNLRLNQLYLSVAFAITLSLIMITWGF